MIANELNSAKSFIFHESANKKEINYQEKKYGLGFDFIKTEKKSKLDLIISLLKSYYCFYRLDQEGKKNVSRHAETKDLAIIF